MKVGDYKLRLTIKAMCLFEQLTGKSFLSYTEEDLLDVLYAMFITSNDLRMSRKAFEILLEDKKVAKWMGDEYIRQSEFNGQLKFYNQDVEDKPGEVSDEDRQTSISEVAGELIASGIDPHYVMYEMELWEMQMYRNAIEEQNKTRLEEGRLWTWFTILPHLDKKSSSKLKHPSDLLPFPWDKDVKEQKQKEFEKNASGAFAFLTKQNKKDDGEQ